MKTQEAPESLPSYTTSHSTERQSSYETKPSLSNIIHSPVTASLLASSIVVISWLNKTIPN